MITVNGQSLDITYSSGISSDFAEQPGATLNVDPWGMDSLTRRYTGRLDMTERELAKYLAKRDFKDPHIEGLFAISWRMVYAAPLPEFEVDFKGVKDGKPREPKIKHGRRIQTVTLPYTGDDGEDDGTTTTLKYYTPFATVLYATRTRPVGAKYMSVVNPTGIQVISMSGDSTREIHYKRGPSLNGATRNSTVLSALANGYNAVVEVTGTVESEQVGQWWENTETIEALLMPRGLTQAKRQASV